MLPLNTETWISREGEQPGEVSNAPDGGTESLPMRNPTVGPAPATATATADAAQAPGGAEATGTVTAATTAGAAGAGAPGAAGQDIEKLADKVWQVVRRKLALEKERRRGVP